MLVFSQVSFFWEYGQPRIIMFVILHPPFNKMFTLASLATVRLKISFRFNLSSLSSNLGVHMTISSAFSYLACFRKAEEDFMVVICRISSGSSFVKTLLRKFLNLHRAFSPCGSSCIQRGLHSWDNVFDVLQQNGSLYYKGIRHPDLASP